MTKRLIICADGTWNEPNQTDNNIVSPSNVAKLASAISPVDSTGITQIVYYHTGLGTQGGFFEHFGGGALGIGISQNIKDLYLFLVLNYNPGDELFFLGFSRGAYSVRSLAGLIRNVGILKNKNLDKFAAAYALYQDRTDASHPNAVRSIHFRAQYSWPDFPIKFIGVWETVGALGIPFPFQIGSKLWEFHDVELSSHIDYAYQALAIDEKRKPFVPCIWVKQWNSPQSQVLEQAWFPGVHSNVGGGYSDAGLSDCALEWMYKKAEGCGLAINTEEKIVPNPAGILRNSMTLWYRLFGTTTRTLGAKLPNSYEILSDTAFQRNALISTYKPMNMRAFMQASQPTEPATTA
jgi:uncharacterized protein (DUF2235 family)